MSSPGVDSALDLVKRAILNGFPCDNFLHSWWICWANSRVGEIIRARIPSFEGDLRWEKIGIKKDIVFPDPVGAQARMSRP